LKLKTHQLPFLIIFDKHYGDKIKYNDGNIRNPYPFFGPMKITDYKSYRLMFFENVKMQKGFCDWLVVRGLNIQFV